VGPTSPLIIAVLLIAAAALLVALAQVGFVAVKILCGALALTVAMFSGLVLVNDYYGYYRTWGDVVKDVTGSGPTHDYAGRSLLPGGQVIENGSVEQISLQGKLSGITRSALVYLPPQYNNPKFRMVRFPVMELFHGSPGKPTDWIRSLHVNLVMDRLIAGHQIGPMVLVMPATSQGNAVEECLNSSRGEDDTYLSTDVPTEIRHKFRVASDPAQWGLMGFSSGGYCAANLALRHPAAFGSAASLDGYYQPLDGPAAAVLQQDPALEQINNPLAAANSLSQSAAPLPSFWLMAGTGGAESKQAAAFVTAMSHVEQVPLTLVRGANHDFYAWQSVLPQAMEWTWRTLATPDLRTLFPLLAPSEVHTVPGPLAPPGRTRDNRHPSHGGKHSSSPASPAPSQSRPSQSTSVQSTPTQSTSPFRGT
jgi:enterochelin esterase-like enzyme